jgi:hypothetical protein
VIHGLVRTEVVAELMEDGDGSLEGGDVLFGGDAIGGSGFLSGKTAKLLSTAEGVEAILFGLLEGDSVGGAGERLLDNVELTIDEVNLPTLPEIRVVGTALIMFTAE